MGDVIATLGIVGLCVFFCPTVFALLRRHTSVGGIFVVNVFFGLTGIGWVIALAWSLSDPGVRYVKQDPRPGGAPGYPPTMVVHHVYDNRPPVIQNAETPKAPQPALIEAKAVDPKWPKFKAAAKVWMVRAAERGSDFYEGSCAKFGRENVLAFAAMLGLATIVLVLVFSR